MQQHIKQNIEMTQMWSRKCRQTLLTLRSTAKSGINFVVSSQQFWTDVFMDILPVVSKILGVGVVFYSCQMPPTGIEKSKCSHFVVVLQLIGSQKVVLLQSYHCIHKKTLTAKRLHMSSYLRDFKKIRSKKEVEKQSQMSQS